MSEFGCITNGRTFEEVASLYSTNMTSVFSGGLVFEYSQEGNGFGLVTISNDIVTPNAQFTSLVTAYKNAVNPTGSGGAKTNSTASTCPAASDQWEVTNDDLPAIPSAAAALMTKGAGTGPGLTGAGSQSAGDSENESSGTASAGSGAVTTTVSSTSAESTNKANAASSLRLDGSLLSAVSAVGLVAFLL